jgi:hypothetical protein
MMKKDILTNIQKKKIDFLLEQGGEIIDALVKVRMPGFTAIVDTYGKVVYYDDETLPPRFPVKDLEGLMP